MRFLLDEMFHEVVAESLNPLIGQAEDSCDHILQHRPRGTKDLDIPPLCRALEIDALVTVNFKDFGARKVYYQALLDAGVSVIVIRPGKVRLTPNEQVAILASKFPRAREYLLEASEPTLIRITQTDVRERSLSELVKEFEAGSGTLP